MPNNNSSACILGALVVLLIMVFLLMEAPRSDKEAYDPYIHARMGSEDPPQSIVSAAVREMYYPDKYWRGKREKLTLDRLRDPRELPEVEGFTLDEIRDPSLTPVVEGYYPDKYWRGKRNDNKNNENLAPHPLQRYVPNPLHNLAQVGPNLPESAYRGTPGTGGLLQGDRLLREPYTNVHSQNPLPGGYQTLGTILTPDGIIPDRVSLPDKTFTFGGIFSQDLKERARQYAKAFKGPPEDVADISPLREEYYPNGFESVYLLEKKRAERTK